MTIHNGMQASDLNVTWRKSSWSGPQGGNCVEFAQLPDGQVALRNSRHPSGPALLFTPAEWDAFSKAVVAGEFDLWFYPRGGPAPAPPPAGAGPRDTPTTVYTDSENGTWPPASHPAPGATCLWGHYAGRSNSPFLAPIRKASHSVLV
jgi:hypothetical protein